MRNKIEALKYEILDLIDSQMEGEYWDFKQEHHENKAELVHDIICMANNRADRDSYIIFGIEDGTYKVLGVENTARRKQIDFINILKGLSFANGIRPTIQLYTIEVQQHFIDILIIKNTTDTPYYLTKDYSELKKFSSKIITVKANFIYTRINDSNTDIDKSADINHVEYLWKKRFLLNKSPLEQIINRLSNKSEWNDREDDIYNIYNPEMTITFEDYDYDNKTMFYSHAMTNNSTSFKICKIKYFNVVIFSSEFVVLDSGRYQTPTPTCGNICFEKYDKFSNINSFKYIYQNSIDYKLNMFFYDEENHEETIARRRFFEHVLLFSCEKEHINFVKYIENNKTLYFEKLGKIDDYIIETNNELEKEVYNNQLKIGKVLTEMLKEYRLLTNNY